MPGKFPRRIDSLELLAKILQRLVRARLLISVQGTRGGYRLGKPAAQISVADVIQAVDGPVTVTACSPDDHACGQYTTCSIRDPLWKIKNRILEMLTTVSVAELAADPRCRPRPRPLRKSLGWCSSRRRENDR